MRTFDLGQIIAERRLALIANDSTSRDVTIKLGAPVPDPEENGRSWACPYQILGIGSDRVHAIFGVDALQALVFAIHTIPGELAAIARKTGGQFLFHDEHDPTFLSACRTALETAGDAFPVFEDAPPTTRD
jgi:Domain of unknown function (DUF6968)